jgi:hypothetical protein
VVRDKKKIINHSETPNFAEIYCNQMLGKKKLKNYRSHIKMKSLMKDVTKF